MIDPLESTRGIKIICLTDKGLILASRLERLLDNAEVLYKPQPFASTVQCAFEQGHRLIMICATGIAVRTLAPVLINKYRDPAVLVLDELGQYVIALLSGHEGGANEWAAQVSQLLAAQCVTTTARSYTQPVYTVGMGCERDCPKDELMNLLQHCLAQVQLSISQISSISSIDIKADEIGLIELAAELDTPYITWNVDQLQAVEALLSTRSQYVFNTVGVYGVAESAALVAARTATGDQSELVLVKQKNKKATCAIARSYVKDQ